MKEKAISNPSRKVYIEFLRLVAAYFVIVNHTNSQIFLESSISVTWFISLTRFFVCKIAVPVFVFILGAVLLEKQDSYEKHRKRILRISGILLGFSVVYYLHECCLDTCEMSLGVFFKRLSNQQITNAFWFLYMYIGVLIILPFLQRLRAVLSKDEIRLLILLSLGIGGTAPLLFDFLGVSIPKHMYEVFFHPYVGMVFAGYYLDSYCKPSGKSFLIAFVLFIAMVTMQVFLTWKSYLNNPDSILIFDNNTYLPITVSAASVYHMVMYVFSHVRISSYVEKTICTLGSMMFSVYLISDMMIEMTKPMYSYLITHMGITKAMISWEWIIYSMCIFVAVIMKNIPVLKRIL